MWIAHQKRAIFLKLVNYLDERGNLKTEMIHHLLHLLLMNQFLNQQENTITNIQK